MTQNYQALHVGSRNFENETMVFESLDNTPLIDHLKKIILQMSWLDGRGGRPVMLPLRIHLLEDSATEVPFISNAPLQYEPARVSSRITNNIRIASGYASIDTEPRATMIVCGDEVHFSVMRGRIFGSATLTRGELVELVRGMKNSHVNTPPVHKAVESQNNPCL